MRVAFIEYEVPNVEHSTVTYTGFLSIKALSDAGHKVSAILLLPQKSHLSDPDTRQRWLQELAELGIEIHTLPSDPPERTNRYRRIHRVRRAIWPRISDYFPHTALVSKVAATLETIHPDAIFLWGGYEAVAATHGLAIAPRLAFVGDPVHLPELYRQYPPLVAKRSPIAPSLLFYKLEALQRARMMIRLLSECESVLATAAHHTEWFRRNGLPHCRYLPGMVPDWGGPDWQDRRKRHASNGRFKIVLMGHVAGTATLTGLYLFANETLPVLEQALGGSFEVHVCGKDKLPPDLAIKLDRPCVRVRGFVDDMIRELLTCDVFLVPTPIPLGIRVRIAYAWSVGCCVVSHEANALGLAEISQGENALLAADGQGLAQAIIRVRNDPALRHQLSLGGRETYERCFSHEVTSGKIISELERLVHSGHRAAWVE